MVRLRTRSERANSRPGSTASVVACATCGGTEGLRLYELRRDIDEPRRWWCDDCSVIARSQGLEAILAPVWVERAALWQLPLKPIDVRRDGLAVAGRRATDGSG
jgi:hypothetical protein